MELVKLRQQQQTTRAYLQSMELRLQGTEKKQQQMMSFLAKAMQNPEFIRQLVQQKEKRQELEEAFSKKRRRPIEQSQGCIHGGESSTQVKIEPSEFGDPYYYHRQHQHQHQNHHYNHQMSELEALALEMQGLGNRARREEGEEERDDLDKELDEGFWEELLNEGFDDVSEDKDAEEEGEDVNVLADRLGFLGSSLRPKK